MVKRCPPGNNVHSGRGDLLVDDHFAKSGGIRLEGIIIDAAVEIITAGRRFLNPQLFLVPI